MAGEPTITIIGNLAGEVDLRYTPTGAAVAKFTVASTPRSKNRQTDQWEDGETMWFRVTTWRQEAENAAESLVKGTRVMVTGRLKQESWETKEGEKRQSLVITADEVAASMKWAQVDVRKVERGSTKAEKPKPSDDPWAIDTTTDEEPPF